MVLSELVQKPNDSTAGKVAVALVAVAVVGGVGFEIMTSASCASMSNGGYGPQVSAQEQVSSAQKEIDQLNANTTMPASVKKAEIAHLQAQISQAQGKATTTVAGPPPTATH